MSQATSAVHAHTDASHSAHDFARANQTHFDEHADKLEEEHPYARNFGVLSVNAMRDTFPALFDKEHTEVLDYACGTGMFSQALRPYVKNIVGADISQASVDVYNKQAANQGFASQMKAVRAELKGEPGELDGAKFDLITCSAAYHHFADIDTVTHALAFFLKPGGALLVTDIKAAPDGAMLVPETYHHVVPHRHGMTEEKMRTTFEGAGLVEFALKDMQAVKFQPDAPEIMWFVARGVKPAVGA